MMSHNYEETYVTLKVIMNIARGIGSLYRNFRRACWGAGFVGLIPTITLACYMLTTGYPKSWGPLGSMTTLPGHVVAEAILGRPVWLATTEGTYAQHVKDWLLLLCTNFSGWFVIFAILTAALRFFHRKRIHEH